MRENQTAPSSAASHGSSTAVQTRSSDRGNATSGGGRGSARSELRGLTYDEQVAKLSPTGDTGPNGERKMGDAAPRGLPMFRGVGGDHDGESPVQRRASGDEAAPLEESAAPIPFEPLCKEDDDPTKGGDAPSRADIASTNAAIDQLRAAMSLHRELVADNYLENIRRYLTATGGDGGLAMSRTSFTSLATKNVTKTALTSPIKLPMDKAISAILPAVSTGAKLIGGVVLGFVFDALVESVFDPTGKKLRAAFKAGHAAGVAAMADEAKSAIKMRLADEGRDAMLLEELRRAALFSGSKPALDGLNNWIISQLPALSLPVHDLSLYNSMLETWVLQRAGDEEDANKHTDSAAYEAAHEKFATDGNLARRDLFIHQCRFEFGRLGVDAEPTLAIWNKKLTSQPKDLPPDKLIGRLGPLRIEATRFMHPARLIRTLQEANPLIFSPSGTGWDGPGDPADLPAKAPKGSDMGSRLLRENDMTTEKFVRMIQSGGLTLACGVDLTEADGAIFVNRYEYRVWGTRHKSDGMPLDKASDYWLREQEWSESPD